MKIVWVSKSSSGLGSRRTWHAFLHMRQRMADLDADSGVWNAPLMPGWPPAPSLRSANLAGWGICCGNFSRCEDSVQGEIVSTF